MPRYRNVSGIAREVSKRYLNVDGVAREISKGYKNIDGIAREYFSNGVVWKKYYCSYWAEDYTTYEYSDDKGGTLLCEYGDFYDEYETSEHEGIVGVGESIFRYADGRHGDPTDAIGLYYINEDTDFNNCQIVQEAFRVFELTDHHGTTYFRCIMVSEAVATMQFGPHSASLGTVVTEDGAIPDNGKLICGSPQDSYCVVRMSNGHLYYYVRQ